MKFRFYTMLYKYFINNIYSCTNRRFMINIKRHIRIKNCLYTTAIFIAILEFSKIIANGNTSIVLKLKKQNMKTFRFNLLDSSVSLVSATSQVIGEYVNEFDRKSDGLCVYDDGKEQKTLIFNNIIIDTIYLRILQAKKFISNRRMDSFIRETIWPDGISLISITQNSCVFKIQTSGNKTFILKKTKLLENSGFHESELAVILNHNNIVKTFDTSTGTYLYECKYSKRIKQSKICWLLQEYCNEQVKCRYFHNSEKSLRNLAKQLLERVEYLHDLYFIHGDIKPENILGIREKGKIVYKLIDFGFTKSLKYGCQEQRVNKICGTLKYISPEVIKQRIYGRFNDIWSLGLVIYMCLKKGNIAYNTPYSIVNDTFEFEFEENTPELLKDFLKKCLVVDYKKRATVYELLEHPFIRSSGEENLK